MSKKLPTFRKITGMRLWLIRFQGFIQQIPKTLAKPIVRRKPPMQVKRFEYGMPICPRCGEPTYSKEECYFCGQRIELTEYMKKLTEPSPEIRMDCLMCGGHNTLVGHRARSNGHFHGRCEKCGSTIIE